MIRKICLYILGLPKTIYFNFKVLSFRDAIKIPFFISNKIKFGEIHRGNIFFEGKLVPMMIRFGACGSEGIIENRNGWISFTKDSKIIFSGKAVFAKGCSLRVDGGQLRFGNSFSANRNCFISCSKKMIIGNDVLLGWNVNVRDSDGHKIYKNEKLKENQKEVSIGDHVWIASYADILKGVKIGNNNVVSYRSLVTKSFVGHNILIGGCPAEIIQENINWEK